MSERIDYRGFFQRLSGLVTTKASGTLFTRTEKNHLIIVAVRDGRIISLACGPRHGEAAIPLIRQMQSGDVRLDTGAIPYHERELPPTSQIIAALEPGEPAAASRPATVPPAPAAAGDRAAPQGTEKASGLCELLTDFIGPVAPLVCREKIAAAGGLDDPGRIEDVIGGLAAEIQDASEAKEFVARARRLLQAAGTVPSAPVAPAPVTPPVQEPLLSALDTGRAKESLCDLLTGYLGPVAPIICEEKVATMKGGGQRHEFEAAINEIALEIDDRVEAEEFVAEAWRRLRALGA